MGMFDWVQCEYPLPGNPPVQHKGDWQTKDTPKQSLSVYKIDEYGNFFLSAGHGKWLTCNNFCESIRFYTHDINDRWWEYEATFDHGALTDLMLVRFDANIYNNYNP